MAKKKRSLFNISGTLYGMTHVESKAYGSHVRAARGTVKPAKLNAKLMQNVRDMPKANAYAKTIKDALDPHRVDIYDGRLWSRLVSVFKKQFKAGQLPDYSLLEGDELHEEHTLEQLMPGLEAEVTMKKKEMDVRLEYDEHPLFRDAKMTMYTLSVVGVFIDRKALKAVSEAMLFERLKCKGRIVPLVATLAVPKKADVVVVCVKVTGVLDDGEPSNSLKVKGMKIVKVSEL
jgi:hypothetical protein